MQKYTSCLLLLLVAAYISSDFVHASGADSKTGELAASEQVIKKTDQEQTDRVLDVVTNSRDVQRLIIGYLGFVESKPRSNAKSSIGALLSGLANTKLHFLQDNKHYLFSSAYGGFDIRDINAENSNAYIASSLSVKDDREIGSIQKVINLDNGCFATLTRNPVLDIWSLHHKWGEGGRQIVHMRKIDLANNHAQLAYCPRKRLLFWGEMLSNNILRVKSQYLNEWQNGNMQTEYTFTLLPRDHKVQDKARLTALSVSPNGAYIAVAIDTTQEVRIYERETGEFLAKLPHSTYQVSDIMWLDNTICITGSQDYTILLWDMSNAENPHLIKKLTGHEPGQKEKTGVILTNVGFRTYDPDFQSSYFAPVYYQLCAERGVLVSSVGNVIKVWDIKSGDCLSTIDYADASQITLSPNGEYVIGSKLGSATIYEVADPLAVKLLKQTEITGSLIKK